MFSFFYLFVDTNIQRFFDFANFFKDIFKIIFLGQKNSS